LEVAVPTSPPPFLTITSLKPHLLFQISNTKKEEVDKHYYKFHITEQYIQFDLPVDSAVH